MRWDDDHKMSALLEKMLSNTYNCLCWHGAFTQQ